MAYLYYCKKCNELGCSNYENKMINCPDCGQAFYPLHITDVEWDEIDDDEKRDVIRMATITIKKPPKQTSTQRRESENYNHQNNNYTENTKRTTSAVSIVGFIFSFLGILSFVGVILGIIGTAKRDGKKKGLAIAAIAVGSFVFMASAYTLGKNTSDKKELSLATNEEAKTSELTVADTDDNSGDSSSNNSNQIVTINEQVLVDQDGVKITAVEYVTDSIWGDGIKMLLENNTSQKLMFSCDALMVNDYMITDLFAQSVSPGNSAYETLYLSNSQLKEAGIDNVGKIDMYFRIYDDDTWADLFTTDCITLQTSDYASMDTTANIEGIELYNKNDIRIVAKYVDEHSFWGKAILLYAENNTSRNIRISADNVAVNGIMFTPMYVDTIYSGKRSIDNITLFRSELKDNNVSEIRDVDIQFNIYDVDTFEQIDTTDQIKFSVN